MINKIIPLWLKGRMHQSIWLLLSFLIATCWLLDNSNIFLQAIERILNPKQGKITLTLFLLGTGLFASLFVQYLENKKKPKIKDYQIINPPGFMKNKKTGAYFCQRCLLKDHLATELSTISRKEFRCRVCKEPYEIDYSVLICDEYLSMLHKEAGNELIHQK